MKRCDIYFDGPLAPIAESESVVIFRDDWYTIVFDVLRDAQRDVGHYWPYNWEVAVLWQ